MSRPRLLELHAQLTATLRASETWEKSYRADKATFKALVREEAEMQANLVNYFAGLAERVRGLIDWSDKEVEALMASAMPGKNDPAWKVEQQLLTNALHQNILNLMVIGGKAGEAGYNRPIGITTLDEFILDAADRYTAKLVSNVTDTTRGYISRAISQSIATGEDSTATVDRIINLVSNPVRAEMIAQTESVNAYQTGLNHFANQTGAVSKTWDALEGVCDYCGGPDGPAGKTIDIDQEFDLPDGSTIDIPPAHPRCRCGIIYNYAK